MTIVGKLFVNANDNLEYGARRPSIVPRAQKGDVADKRTDEQLKPQTKTRKSKDAKVAPFTRSVKV